MQKKTSCLLDSSSSIKCHLDQEPIIVEVPVSSRIVSFFTYLKNHINRVWNVGVVSVTDDLSS